MPRFDATSETGCVRWPTDWPSTGEGGMTVYAVWREKTYPDPFITCSAGASVEFTIHESLIAAVPSSGGKLSSSHRSVDGNGWRDYEEEGMVGALCLGSTGGAWCHDRDGYFEATMESLTDAGKRIVVALNELYGREAVLLTLLDT